MQEFVLALIGAAFPWMTIWVIAMRFSQLGKREAEREERLLRTLDDLTAQIVAFKNPWAAQVFARTQSLRDVPPYKDDEQMQRDLEGGRAELGEQDLV